MLAIHRAMLRIVSEVGLKIEAPQLVVKMAEGGGTPHEDGRVTFTAEYVERFIAESDPFDWARAAPRAGAHLGIYHGPYLDPETNEFVPFTHERLTACFKLATHLEHVEGVDLQNCPLDIPRAVEPLYARLYAARWGAGCPSIWHVDLCPYVEEFTQIIADDRGVDPKAAFTGGTYLVSPLQLAREQAELFMYFYERGYRVYIGHMASAGGTAPVTLAGSLALHISEAVLIQILNRILFGGRTFGIGSSIAPLDMRTGIYPYGRPEMALANVAMAQMARFYGTGYWGHCGLSDAKRPSAEAGAQKLLSAIPCLMAGGSASISAGTLSIDEVKSPVQMVIDNEITGALKRFATGFEISDETLAVDLIKTVGPGGTFLDSEHTLKHFRTEHWQPAIWAREMYQGWRETGSKIDADRARERCLDIIALPEPDPCISSEAESRLRAVLGRATRALG